MVSIVLDLIANGIANGGVRLRFGIFVMGTALLFGGCTRMKSAQIESIQKAAVVDLNLVYEAQMAFHKVHGFYTTDLKALGISPKAVLYKFGFTQASSTGDGALEDHDPTRKDLDQLNKIRSKPIAYSPVTKLAQIDFDLAAGQHCPECTATADRFKMVAFANLDDDTDLDVWTIDEKKQVVHLKDDLKP